MYPQAFRRIKRTNSEHLTLSCIRVSSYIQGAKNPILNIFNMYFKGDEDLFVEFL